MATTTTTTTTTKRQTLPTTKLVCFSFAAYAKNLIDNLKSLNIPVLPGLTDLEFTSIESTFRFSFPPDLRSILQEGIPIGPHFPNWRSSSLQQLQILLSLPFLNLSRNISQNNFWVDSWGDKPRDNKTAIDMAKGFLGQAPVLVPIYWNCYIPSAPNVAGNPVFYVDDGHVRVLSFDVTRFFQEAEFLKMGFDVLKRPSSFLTKEDVCINVPAWAATKARRIEFWTDVAERGRRVVVREPSRGWWSGGDDLGKCKLKDCLEEVFWRLRDGGWKEEEVKDMMMMDGCDWNGAKGCCGAEFGNEELEYHVSVMSLVLLRAGWSREDIVYSLNLQDDRDGTTSSTTHLDGVSFLDLKVQLPKSSSRKNGDNQISKIGPLATLFPVKDEDLKFKSRHKWDGRKPFSNRLRPPKTQKKKKHESNN